MFYKKILAAIDLDDKYENIILAAKNLKNVFKSNLVFVTILRPFNDVYYSHLGADSYISETIEFNEESTNKINKKLKIISRKFKLSSDDFSLIIGDPVNEIQKKAASLDADLIVLGTHGRGGMAKLLMGSTASSLLSKTATDILAINLNKNEKDKERGPEKKENIANK